MTPERAKFLAESIVIDLVKRELETYKAWRDDDDESYEVYSTANERLIRSIAIALAESSTCTKRAVPLEPVLLSIALGAALCLMAVSS